VFRRLAAASAIAAAPILLTFTASSAMALPAACGYSEHCIVTYYYNAAHTEYAGTLYLPCSGDSFYTGDVDTAYYVVNVPNQCSGGGQN